MEGRRKNSEFAFSDLIHSDQMYFDQTLLVRHLHDESRSAAVVITSPSGVGKSVILSMCHAFTDKFAEPNLFDPFQLKSQHGNFFAAHHNQYFNLYFDFAALQADTFEQFKAMLWLLMRSTIITAKHKLQHWFNHKVSLDHPDLQIILSSEYQPTLTDVLIRSLASLCHWITVQGIESKLINIYIDHHDTGSRYAMINGNMSLCRKSADFISQLLFFINQADRPYFRMILAGQEGVRDSKQLKESYQDMLEYINLYSGEIQLGLTMQELESKCPHISQTVLLEDCCWYQTCNTAVTSFTSAQKLLGLTQTIDDTLSSRRVIAGAIGLFEYPELINAMHTLGLLAEPLVYQRVFYLSTLGEYDSWFVQLLLVTGYITFADKDNATLALTSRMSVEFKIINDSLSDEIETLIRNRSKALQPHYAKHTNTLFKQASKANDAFKNLTTRDCVML